MLISFENQCVVVTGASKGIGLACALAFAQAGAKVVAVSRSQANLQRARELAHKQGLVLHTLATDLSQSPAAAQAVVDIEAEHGPIDVLINSAGAPKGVRVNAINPGLTQTSRVEEGMQALARATGRSPEELLAEQIADIPMGRMAEPAEIANMALFLASPHASYVSGAVIPMDGCASSVI